MTRPARARRDRPWGGPVTGRPDGEVVGDDRDLARCVAAMGGAGRAPLVRFDASPDADLARAVGLVGSGTGAHEVPLDAIVLRVDDEEVFAVNAVVVGPPPDRLRWWHRRRPSAVHVDGRTVFEGRAGAVVIANGQFLRGRDLVPAGHPGDGRLEVQVYALDPAERAPMRRRLGAAAHLPHPRIVTATGREVAVQWATAGPLEVDGHPWVPAAWGRRRPRAGIGLSVGVRPGAYRLVV